VPVRDPIADPVSSPDLGNPGLASLVQTDRGQVNPVPVNRGQLQVVEDSRRRALLVRGTIVRERELPVSSVERQPGRSDRLRGLVKGLRGLVKVPLNARPGDLVPVVSPTLVAAARRRNQKQDESVQARRALAYPEQVSRGLALRRRLREQTAAVRSTDPNVRLLPLVRRKRAQVGRVVGRLRQVMRVVAINAKTTPGAANGAKNAVATIELWRRTPRRNGHMSHASGRFIFSETGGTRENV